MIKIERADGSATSVRRSTLGDLMAAGGYETAYLLEGHEVAEPYDVEVIVLENGSSHAYVISGNLEAFARKVVEAVHGEVGGPAYAGTPDTEETTHG